MALGHEDDDGRVAGIVAACMALVAIVAAKVAIPIAIAHAVAEHDIVLNQGQPTSLQRDLAAHELLREEFKLRGLDDPTDEQIELALDRAREKVDGMSPEQIAEQMKSWDKRVGRRRTQDGSPTIRRGDSSDVTGLERRLARAARTKEPAVDPPAKVSPPSAEANQPQPAAPAENDADFGTTWSPLDALFLLLACATAYRVGSRQRVG